MSQTNEISVIVPNWNYSMFLRPCLDSILRQTVRPARIIITDDASTDGSRPIIEAFATAYPDLVRTIFREENVGTIINENAAADLVDTEWMFYLDADDMIDHRYIEKVIKVIEKRDDPKLAVVYSDMRKYGDWEGIWVVSDWDPELLRKGNYINGHSVFRKSVFDRVGRLKDNNNFEDHQLWVDILDLNEGYYGVHIPEPLVWYQRHGYGHRTDKTDKEKRS